MYTYFYSNGTIAGARNNRPPIRKSGSGSLLTNNTKNTSTSSTSKRGNMSSSSGRLVNSSVCIGGKR